MTLKSGIGSLVLSFVLVVLISVFVACSDGAGEPSGQSENTIGHNQIDLESNKTTEEKVIAVVKEYLRNNGASYMPPHEITHRGDDYWEVAVTAVEVTSYFHVDPKELRVIKVIPGF
jgi:hypothetical protein